MKRDRLAWPILLLLLTVLVPSVGVVWMMREAVRNERAATNQRLLEAYRLQLDQAAKTLKNRWGMKQSKLSGLVTEGQPAFSFAKIVTNSSVDSVVLCDKGARLFTPKRTARLNVFIQTMTHDGRKPIVWSLSNVSTWKPQRPMMT